MILILWRLLILTSFSNIVKSSHTERNQTVKYIPIGWHAFDIAPQITTNHDDN